MNVHAQTAMMATQGTIQAALTLMNVLWEADFIALRTTIPQVADPMQGATIGKLAMTGESFSVLKCICYRLEL